MKSFTIKLDDRVVACLMMIWTMEQRRQLQKMLQLIIDKYISEVTDKDENRSKE